MKKTMLIFICLSLILISLTSVSAQGNDTADFDDLSSDINLTAENHTLVLQNDYETTHDAQSIIINKSITIDGANHKIKASDASRVFLIKADNVCIKNINFINSGSSSLAGGAISWLGNNGTLQNCNFTNSSAVSAGGAVLWGGNDGIIKNCNFMNNTVKIGAAVSLTRFEGFDPTQLHIQTVNSEGGALYIDGNNVSVDYCNFLDNLAMFNGGAVSINWGNNVVISNSRFKNNVASYNGGAIDWNSQNALLINSTFEKNSPKNLFLNANAEIINSTFDKKSSIESWHDAKYINVTFSDLGSFEELSLKINCTPEYGVLVLDKDYEYINGTNKGILISKPITIDGAGHTLCGNKLSRMFNVTSDNVTIKNINFIKGNAFGRYGGIAGGGAIFWTGDNGFIENCSFTSNTGAGIEDDPFDKPQTIILEDGTVIERFIMRPMGVKINEGGAIDWFGNNGTVSKCVFRNNTVGYPNYGGAICWKGNDGKVIGSKFLDNGAWCGSAIVWIGDNGKIFSSFVANCTFIDGGIYWFGKNGIIRDSILLGSNYYSALRGSGVNADYNFWGDTLENPNNVEKYENLNNWLVMKFSHNGQFVKKGDKVIIKSDITTLYNRNGKLSSYGALINYSSQISYTATKTGFLDITFKNGKVDVGIDTKDRIISSNLNKYYNKKISFAVKVYDINGKVISKKVKFTINKRNYYSYTNKNGVATLKLNLKPGKYTIYTSYGKAKVKNKITVKSILITKNVSKKVKKSGKFFVKTLNSKGKPYAKQTVKIKFKGKTYNIKTNINGIAAFKLSAKLKVGKHAIKSVYNGLTNTNYVIVRK